MQIEVMELVCHGKTSKEIGKQLGKSDNTVIHHLEAVREKLGARNKFHAVAIYLAPERFKKPAV